MAVEVTAGCLNVRLLTLTEGSPSSLQLLKVTINVKRKIEIVVTFPRLNHFKSSRTKFNGQGTLSTQHKATYYELRD